MCLPSQWRKVLDTRVVLVLIVTILSLEAAKITCRQYLFDRTISPEAPRIATWLSGYFNGVRNNTMIDIGTIRSNKDKVEDYCRMNQDVTIMDAARKALGLDKQ
jgi:hypothetical protein